MTPQELDMLLRISRIGQTIGLHVVSSWSAQQSIPQIQPTQEQSEMSTEIEKVTRVSGIELAHASEDRLISMIKQFQEQKKALADLPRGDYVNSKVKAIDAAVAEVTAELNRRVPAVAAEAPAAQ